MTKSRATPDLHARPADDADRDALLVTDADGVLRALDWEDYEARMKELLRLHYGAVDLTSGRAPKAMRSALSAYFEGDFDRLDDDRMARRRHAVPAQGLDRAAQDSRRHRP